MVGDLAEDHAMLSYLSKLTTQKSPLQRGLFCSMHENLSGAEGLRCHELTALFPPVSLTLQFQGDPRHMCPLITGAGQLIIARHPLSLTAGNGGSAIW